jgi:hypothetical protein
MSASKSLRNKIDNFFSPGASANKSKGMSLSKDLEDPVDIYSHVKTFKAKNTENDDNFVKTIEIGERRIKGDLDELDQMIYGGKKVTREALNKQESDDHDEDEDMIEEDDQEDLEEEEDDDQEDEEIDSDEVDGEAEDDDD